MPCPVLVSEMYGGQCFEFRDVGTMRVRVRVRVRVMVKKTNDVEATFVLCHCLLGLFLLGFEYELKPKNMYQIYINITLIGA